MKRALQLTAGALVVGFGLPALLLSRKPKPIPAEEPQQTQETAEEPQQTEGTEDGQCRLQVLLEDESVENMAMDEYLTGVLLAEMPVSFAPEAIKAQAVVSRTYTLRRMEDSKHPEADICTDAGCCQGWRNPEAFAAQAGQEGVTLVREAIAATDGQALTYEGSLIDATFFSCSGGRTEAAVEVWGSDVPYLQSVDSPGEEAPHNEDLEGFSPEEFAAAILAAAPEASLTGPPETWFGSMVETEGGGVASLEVGGVPFTGTQLRSALGLRSTVFQIHVVGDEIQIQTQGFGHRVGMSQYGAEAMAREGSTYEEILYHYYTGVTLENYLSNKRFS